MADGFRGGGSLAVAVRGGAVRVDVPPRADAVRGAVVRVDVPQRVVVVRVGVLSRANSRDDLRHRDDSVDFRVRDESQAGSVKNHQRLHHRRHQLVVSKADPC